MSDSIFKQAKVKADAHDDPSLALQALGVNTNEALDAAMTVASQIVLASGDTFDLILNVASLFMTGVSVGVEIPALAAERGEAVAN